MSFQEFLSEAKKPSPSFKSKGTVDLTMEWNSLFVAMTEGIESSAEGDGDAFDWAEDVAQSVATAMIKAGNMAAKKNGVNLRFT